MKEPDSLYIERCNDANCYRCIRECPIKAVVITEQGAHIDPIRCIECGSCLSKCKTGNIIVRDDVHLIREIINSGRTVVASVTPQWTTEFDGISREAFLETLKILGFSHISESALGAEVTMQKELELSSAKGGIYISSRCPSVVDYVLKHKPRLAPFLLPVASPMVQHARIIKDLWGEECCFVHISSCVAAKSEAARNPETDFAITFTELKRWIKDRGIELAKLKPSGSNGFEPYEAAKWLEYPLCGVIPSTDDLLVISASSVEKIRDLLDVTFVPEEKPVYLDLLACVGGCTGSNGASSEKISSINKRMNFEKYVYSKRNLKKDYQLPAVPHNRVFYDRQKVNTFVSEGDTIVALDELGISIPSMQSDCNGCGYGTCRRFAKALSRGEVTREICTYYLKNQIMSKFEVLIDRLSVGVAIISDSMKIEDGNRVLATMLGQEAELLYEKNPGFRGMNATEILPFSSVVSSVLENGDDSVVRDIQIKERIVTVSIHTIRKYKSVLIICRNMLFSQVRNEEIVARTQKVVNENLEAVRKIALMLGENASRTEAILNSILKAQSDNNGR